MNPTDTPIANSMLVFRDEFDDWAILFDPDTGNSYGLNPVSSFIWKNLDGTKTVHDIHQSLLKNCDDAPENAQSHIHSFIEDLVSKGYAGFEKE